MCVLESRFIWHVHCTVVPPLPFNQLRCTNHTCKYSQLPVTMSLMLVTPILHKIKQPIPNIGTHYYPVPYQARTLCRCKTAQVVEDQERIKLSFRHQAGTKKFSPKAPLSFQWLHMEDSERKSRLQPAEAGNPTAEGWGNQNPCRLLCLHQRCLPICNARARAKYMYGCLQVRLPMLQTA